MALQVVRHLRHLIGAHRLIVGSVESPIPSMRLIYQAGSNLVEIYSGLVYRGPGLIADCAWHARAERPLDGRSLIRRPP
jgi:dihydroorotate dehydrogenase